MPGIPGRGERIGSAFVRVFFTGDNSGIRDALDDPELRDAAEESGTEIGEAQGEARNEAWIRKLREGLAEEDQVNIEREKQLERSISATKGTVTRFTNLANAEMGTWDASIERTREHIADLDREIDKGNKSIARQVDFADLWRQEFDRLNTEIDKTNDTLADLFGARSIRNAQALRAEADRMSDSLQEGEDHIANFVQGFEDAHTKIVQVGDDVDRDSDGVRRFGSRINTVTRDVDRLADRFLRFAPSVGRLFGLGSRNNLLNFIGAVVKNLLTVPFLVFKAFTSIANFFTERLTGAVSAVGEEANTASQNVQKLAVAFLSSLPEVIIIVVALVAAVTALAQVLQAVASLISGIAAAIIALASSLSFALVGALAPLLGVIGPLGFGLGVIIAGFIGIKKNADLLKNKVKPLVDDFKKLGAAADDAFFQHAGPLFENLHDLIDRLREPFRRIGAEFGNLAAAAQENLAAPGSPFQRWLHLLNVQAPRQIHVLGVAFGHFANAIAGLFIDLRKPVFQMDDAIRDLAERFDNFVNSTEGRQQILDFLDKAGDAARRWGDLLGAARDVVFDLLFSPSGLEAGNNIIDGLTRALQRFDDAISATGGKPIFSEVAQGPGGGIGQPPQITPIQDPLADFFAHGQQVAEDLGNIAVSIGQIFAAFDNPEGQRNLHDFLDLLGTLGRMAGPLQATLDVLNAMFNATLLGLIVRFPHQIGTALGKIKDFFSPGGFGDLRGGLVIGVHLVGREQVLNALSNLQERAGNIAGRIKDRINRALSGIPDDFKRTFALAALAMIFPFPAAIGILLANIRSIPDRLRSLKDRFGTLAGEWVQAIKDKFTGIKDDIASKFTGLGAAITSAIGTAVLHFTIEGPTGLLDKLANLAPGSFALKEGIKLFGGAAGGLFDSPALRVIGEAGPEALVPLNRPLSQVDPSVRILSAIAQGIPLHQTQRTGPTIDVGGVHIHGFTDDPQLVAWQVVNRIAVATSLL